MDGDATQILEHPDLAIDDVVLLRDLRTGRIAPPYLSVVVTGYRAGRVCWICPRTDTTGFGPSRSFVRAPEKWQDPPRPPWSAVDFVELAHDGEVPPEEREAAEAVDGTPEARAERLDFLERLAGWYAAHLSRIDPIEAALQVCLTLEAARKEREGL